MKKFICLWLAITLSGCVTYDYYYELDEQYLARRQLETRRFETKDEETLIVASAQVLQDLGFTLEESDTKLGLLTGVKDREAGSVGEKVAVIFLAALTGVQPAYATNQKIYATLISTRSHDKNGYNVRIEFARIVWNNQGTAHMQKIEDEEIYRDFFDKLSQSVFLTANNI